MHNAMVTRETKFFQNYFSLDRRSSETHSVSKNCAKLFLSELRQMSTNFDNIWQKDGKEAKIMQGTLNSHLT